MTAEELRAAIQRWVAADKATLAVFDDPGDHSVVTPAEERHLYEDLEDAERALYRIAGEDHDKLWDDGEVVS